MVSFEEAGRILDEVADSLPEEIYKDLNGGINLLPQEVRDDNGLCILGRYFRGVMGRYVEIYYGSFRAVFGRVSERKFREELSKTLRHELTHHLEGLAGDRSLEKWDEQHMAELLSPRRYDGPADSALFAGGYKGPGKESVLRRRHRPISDSLEGRGDDEA